MSKKTAIIILLIFIILSSATTFIFRKSISSNFKNDNEIVEKKEDKAPSLVLKENRLIIYQDDILNYEAFILEANDNEDGDLKSQVEHNVIDTSEVGEYNLEYKVTDSSGNQTIKNIIIIVREKLPVAGD